MRAFGRLYLRSFTSALLGALAVLASAFGAANGRGGLVVSSPADLVSALAHSHNGQKILLRSGTYELNESLFIPAGVTLNGEGTMLFNSSGWPAGMSPGTETVLKSTASVAGDFITCGDGASLRGLTIQHLEGRPGNVIAIRSRSAADNVSASIDLCEIINPNASGVGPQGPSGRAVFVGTRNVNAGAAPAPDNDSSLALTMTRSLIRSPGGGTGLFVVNFASRGHIEVQLESNVIGGGLDATAGASRPDSVSDSSVSIESTDNMYRADNPLSIIGWLLGGGTDAPVPGIIAGASTANRMRVSSAGDVIEGFQVGIFATAGRRNAASAGPVSRNEVQLSVAGLSLKTLVADLRLYGERSNIPGIAAGDRNHLRVLLVHTTGSGVRDNGFGHELNALSTGTSSRLEIVGSPRSFARSNTWINPSPPPGFFTSVD